MKAILIYNQKIVDIMAVVEEEKHCKNQMQTGNFARALGIAKGEGRKGGRMPAPRVEEKTQPPRYNNHR